MKQQDNHEANPTRIQIEDLTIEEGQSTAVKGGPIYMNYDGIDGDVTSAGYEGWISPSTARPIGEFTFSPNKKR